jgi:hypothetical protein
MVSCFVTFSGIVLSRVANARQRGVNGKASLSEKLVILRE